MSRLVLRVERGGRLLGSWSLNGDPLQMSLHDLTTGEEIGRFVASAPGAAHDEVPHATPSRSTGDDLTMPLPERTETGALETTDAGDQQQTVIRRRPVNLAKAFRPALSAGPAAEPDERSMELELDEDVLADAINDADDPLDDVSLALPLPEPVAEPPPPTEDVPRVSKPRPIRPVAVRGAEVWVMRNDSWISGGRIQPGQRARSRGGWVRLERDGSLSLASGPELAGTATLPDGRTVSVPAQSEELRFVPGTSILLRAQQHGLYVRSEAAPLRGGAALG